MTNACPSAEKLRGLVDGSLTSPEADELQLHLEHCPGCQQILQELVADGDFWDTASANLSAEEDAGPALERIVDELRQQSLDDANEAGEAMELKLSSIEPPTEPGTIGRLKHYDILRVAGRGGMGIVVKAFDRTLRRVVAIKLLAPHLAGNGQARQRFVRECRAAAAICHEHVVTIHAVEETPPFLVMQYIQGETLESRIHRNGACDLRETVRIAQQIADGLAAAHEQGVVHRDIKPANILLENGISRVCITDFGLARAVDDASLTQSGVVAGTPQYMAPEQASGDTVDERADLFSLGSVIYTMLAGHAPFRATTTMGVLKRLCDHSPRPIREINPDVPDWLTMLVNRLHAKRPADRFQTAREVADLLKRGLASLQNASSVGTPLLAHRPDSMLPAVVESPTGEVPQSAMKTRDTTGDSADHPAQTPELTQAVAASKRSLSRRFIARVREIAPSGILSWIGWLTAVIAPLVVWNLVYARLEALVISRLEDPAVCDRLIAVTLGFVVTAWGFLAYRWFERKRADGTPLFSLPIRWAGFAASLIAAGLIGAEQYEQWYFSHIHDEQQGEAAVARAVDRPSPLMGVEILMDNMPAEASVVLELSDDQTVTLAAASPNLQLASESEHPVTYPWKALLGRTTFATGEVTLIPNETVSIEVPAPRLQQLVQGRWQQASRQPLEEAGFGMAGGMFGMGGPEEAKIAEFEFDGEVFSAASYPRPSQGQTFRFTIDSSVTPALLNLVGPNGQRVAGIIKFEPGPGLLQFDGSAMGGGMMGDMGGDMSDSGQYGMDNPMGMGGGLGGGAGDMSSDGGFPASRPSDRLVICLGQPGQLRPWSFRTDVQHGHTLFALERSPKSGSLHHDLALEPVPMGAARSSIQDSIAAWERQLKIKSPGSNSIGVELVLVPPAEVDLENRTPVTFEKLSFETLSPEADSYVRVDQTQRAVTRLYTSPFVISQAPISVAQFREFITQTNYVTDAEKSSKDDNAEIDPENGFALLQTSGGYRGRETISWDDQLSWRLDAAEPDRPVLVVSWRDAQAFCEWLTAKEGRQYRLPTRNEWIAAMQMGGQQVSDSWMVTPEKHPLNLTLTDELFGEWTQDFAFNRLPDQRLIGQRESRNGGKEFSAQQLYMAPENFRSTGVGFRIVTELQSLATDEIEATGSP